MRQARPCYCRHARDKDHTVVGIQEVVIGITCPYDRAFLKRRAFMTAAPRARMTGASGDGFGNS